MSGPELSYTRRQGNAPRSAQPKVLRTPGVGEGGGVQKESVEQEKEGIKRIKSNSIIKQYFTTASGSCLREWETGTKRQQTGAALSSNRSGREGLASPLCLHFIGQSGAPHIHHLSALETPSCDALTAVICLIQKGGVIYHI